MLSVSVYMQGGTPPLQLFTGSPHASVTFSDRLRKPSRAAQISVLSLPDYPLCLQACFCSFLFFFYNFFHSPFSPFCLNISSSLSILSPFLHTFFICVLHVQLHNILPHFILSAVPSLQSFPLFYPFLLHFQISFLFNQCRFLTFTLYISIFSCLSRIHLLSPPPSVIFYDFYSRSFLIFP